MEETQQPTQHQKTDFVPLQPITPPTSPAQPNPTQPQMYHSPQSQFIGSKKSAWRYTLLFVFLGTIILITATYFARDYIQDKFTNPVTSIKIIPYEQTPLTTNSDTVISTVETPSARNIINLTNDKYEQNSPVIYNDNIAWLDLSENTSEACQLGDLPHQPCISQIILHNISTNSTKKITSTPSWKTNIQLTDNYIAWRERKNQIEFTEEKRFVMNIDTGDINALEKGNLVGENKAVISETEKK